MFKASVTVTVLVETSAHQRRNKGSGLDGSDGIGGARAKQVHPQILSGSTIHVREFHLD